METLFQAISLGDWLVISPADREEITAEGIILPERNTLSRTLELVREHTSVPALKIHLEKVVPPESGLGAGSSNAATLIQYLQNQGFAFPAEEVALRVGADVPFFLVGGSAIGRGYGEILTPLPDTEPEELLIARPEVGCQTVEMFRKLDAYGYSHWPRAEIRNDFEAVAPCESLDLIEILQMAGATEARLSGSGSAVFGVYADAARADIALEYLQQRHRAQFWRAQTLKRAQE